MKYSRRGLVPLSAESDVRVEAQIDLYAGRPATQWEPEEADDVEISECRMFLFGAWRDYEPTDEQMDYMENHVYENMDDYFEFP